MEQQAETGFMLGLLRECHERLAKGIRILLYRAAADLKYRF